MKAFMKEFKEFINRGNVMDMAVGIIMATAFSAVINSIVNDIILAAIGYAMQGVKFSELGFPAENPVIMYGNLIQAIINFIVIAFCVFLMVKAINKMRRKQLEEAAAAAAAAAAEAGPTQEQLLTEIRDLLKKD